MAIPVKETPVLKGKDARAFEEKIKQNEQRKIPTEEYERAVAFFRSVKVVSPNNAN